MASGSGVRVRQHSSPGRWRVLSQHEKEVPLQTGERGFVWYHTPCSEGWGHTLAGATAASPAPAGLEPCEPGVQASPLVSWWLEAGQPRSGWWMGRRWPFPSPPLPSHTPWGSAKSAQGASVLSPGRHRWNFLSGCPGAEVARAASSELGNLPPSFQTRSVQGAPPGAAHPWLHLCAQWPPWMPLPLEQIFLFFSLTLHKPVTGRRYQARKPGTRHASLLLPSEG